MAFLKLIRYKNLLMVLLTMILTKYALIHSYVSPSLTNIEFLLLVFSVLLITAGGYVINDIYDVKTDTINKPNKVFIGNKISKKNARNIYCFLTFLGLILGILLSSLVTDLRFTIVFFFSVLLLFFYSSFAKKKLLLGNFIVSFLIAFSLFIVYIFDVDNTYELNKGTGIQILKILFVYMSFSFLTTLIREIIKDIEDVDGDYAINAKTLPLVIGRKRANRVAIGFTLLLILFLIIVLKEFVENEPIFLGYGILFLLLPLLYFLYKLWEAETKKDYHFLSNFMKLIMLSGILSMLLFKFI